MQSGLAVRERLLAKREGVYDPSVLAEKILDLLQYIETASDGPMTGHRTRTGLYNVAKFRGHSKIGAVEDAITMWLSELIPNSESQVRGLAPNVRPDIVFSFERDAIDDDILVILEAKPVWQRWISSGEEVYLGETLDDCGRGTGTYAWKCIRQVRKDRGKLLSTYTHPRDRLMLLALVFQRPGEVDQRVIESVGSGWTVKSRHIVDLCNPAGDNIGVTGMVFWPA